MGSKRVPLKAEDEPEEDEPFVVSAEEIREQIDRSHLPEEEKRTKRASERVGSEKHEQEDGDSPEERAVQRLVEKLKEKGKSEDWIEDHMDEVRERVREELSPS